MSGAEELTYDKISTLCKVSDERVKAIYTDNTQHADVAPHYSSTLTADQRAYLKCLMRMRQTEFVHEGLRWFDIKRMHIEVVHNNVNGQTNVLAADDSRRALALPEAALSSGLLLDPNLPETKLVKAVTLSAEPQLSYPVKENATINK